MKKAKTPPRRGAGLKETVRDLVSEWGFTAAMVAAMGFGVGVVLWVALGTSFWASAALGLLVSVVLAIVMWFFA